jgi:Ca2+-binding RTX toxin-like protein
MAIFTVGPTSSFPTIAAAMLAAGPADTIQLETGYSNETATVTHSGMTISGGSSSTGIVLQLDTGIATIFLGGTSPITVLDASDGTGITGNDGNNLITVIGGVDAVNGMLGIDRLYVDYRLATGAVTGNSTSNFSEAGGGGRSVTITDGTFENFTVLTGGGADTITVANGNNVVQAGNGANTITAGNGRTPSRAASMPTPSRRAGAATPSMPATAPTSSPPVSATTQFSPAPAPIPSSRVAGRTQSRSAAVRTRSTAVPEATA